MSGMFKSPKMPAPPPTPALPDMEGEELRNARKRRMAEAISKGSGRASTALTQRGLGDYGRMGGDKPDKKMGG